MPFWFSIWDNYCTIAPMLRIIMGVPGVPLKMIVLTYAVQTPKVYSKITFYFSQTIQGRQADILPYGSNISFFIWGKLLLPSLFNTFALESQSQLPVSCSPKTPLFITLRTITYVYAFWNKQQGVWNIEKDWINKSFLLLLFL